MCVDGCVPVLLAMACCCAVMLAQPPVSAAASLQCGLAAVGIFVCVVVVATSCCCCCGCGVQPVAAASLETAEPMCLLWAPKVAFGSSSMLAVACCYLNQTRSAFSSRGFVSFRCVCCACALSASCRSVQEAPELALGAGWQHLRGCGSLA